MTLNFCSSSTSRCLSFPSYVIDFSSEEWKLRAPQSTYHTHLELLHLGIPFTSSLVDVQSRRTFVSSSSIAEAHQCWTGTSASRSRSPCARIGNKKCLLSVNSTRCEACETFGASTGASSSRVIRVRNGAARVVTPAYGHNETSLEEKVAVVWFKHDLRMDDHPGLISAAQYDNVLPLFIFDSSFYAGMLCDELIAMSQ